MEPEFVANRKICIGTITRDRPVMLANLLQSYAELVWPENCEISFLIVENNHKQTVAKIIERFRARVPQARVSYFIEPVLGIARARNAVLNHAIAQQQDLLTFADDDEEVDADWLVELLKERDARDLDIVGAPVRLAPPKSSISWWQKEVWLGLNAINRGVEARSISRRAEGKDNRFKIATGSWMGRLDFFRQTGLRFDDNLGLAGGEDWKLCAEAQALGARTGWTPAALAYETIPLSRLALLYYYRRTRDHARMSYNQESNGGKRLAVKLVGSLSSRFYKIVLAVLTMPFGYRRSLLNCAHLSGSAIGILQGLRGMRSNHYTKVDGH